jgi:putative membrane protein
MLMESLSGFVPFITYFAVGYILILSFLFIYSKVTPYCEWSLMQQNNRTAAIAFGGSFLGFTLVIASAAVNSVSLIDFAI